MLFTEVMFVGVSLSAGKHLLQYAVLNNRLKIQALEEGDMESVLALIAGLEAPMVAIGAPQAPNQGLMTKSRVRRRYNLRPEGKTWANWRVCEYELRQRNIRLYNTPKKKSEAPTWVQHGFDLYKRLGEIDFKISESNRPLKPRELLEVQSHACYTVLLERRPFLKKTLEGRAQRQLILHLEGLAIPDPMPSISSIQQDHLLSGHLPLEELHSSRELDALVNAYTAYLAAVKPERVSQVGDSDEGLIFLPTMSLKSFYI
ncbi:MAG: DUF429 domain-containing protein [Anaerolineales bacterium]|nr:DUF429 domain-containing protein [Anaerolineales bacterium]